MKIRFIVKDNENQPVEGAKVGIKYKLADTILLTMHPQSRFNNVEGSLTVQYDQSKGSLRGRGGIVKGFTETFMPTDLEPKPNPIVTERFIVSPTINIDFLQVVYKDRYGDERFIVEPNCNINLIHADEINP